MSGWRTEVEDSLKLSIFCLRKDRVLRQGWKGVSSWGEANIGITAWVDNEIPKITLDYRVKIDDDWQSLAYDVYLTKTACNLGGFRTWFMCPNCDKKVGILYLLNGKFYCRRCQNLTYRTNNGSKNWRVWHSFYSNEDRAEALYKNRRWQTQYNNKPTKRYTKYNRLLEFANTSAMACLQQEASKKRKAL